ncbi:MAG: hypothetical protein HZA19_05820, partial [Nitrospirae bacterium]|nr:hypothetical protein [Nitrospirota bacterium]
AFHIHEVNRTSFLNLVYRIPVQWDSTFLMLKKDFFKPIRGEEKLNREVGGVIPDLEENYVVRAKDGAKIRSLLKDGDVRGKLKRLEAFPNILVDSHTLMVSKPYDGTRDTTPEKIMENVDLIGQFASAMEVAAGKPVAA